MIQRTIIQDTLILTSGFETLIWWINQNDMCEMISRNMEDTKPLSRYGPVSKDDAKQDIIETIAHGSYYIDTVIGWFEFINGIGEVSV